MPDNDAITRNILKSVSIFLFFQSLLFLVLIAVYNVYRPISLIFYGITVLFHIILAFALIRMKKYFLLLESGKTLSSINLANLLTLTRLSLLPVICYLIVLTKEYPVVPALLVITVIAFLTDLLDGALSRRTHQVTEIGKYLDSASDYSVLFVISIAFYIFELLPLWFFIVVMVRLVSQAIPVIILFFGYGMKAVATPTGKVAVFATMALYAFEILDLLKIPVLGNRMVISYLEWIVGGILAVSFIDKIVFMVRSMRVLIRERSSKESHET